jgi:hypothetical protein
MRIRDFIAACLRQGIDIDFTKTLNLFAILGAKWLEDSDEESRRQAKEVFSPFLDYQKWESSEALAYFREFEEFRKWKLAKASASDCLLKNGV